MSLSRRHFLQTGAAAALSAGVGGVAPAWAQTVVGAAQLDTLSDGTLTLPPEFILGGLPESARDIVTQSGVSLDGPLTPECNLTLWRDGTNTVLFDVGAGPDFMSSAGQLADAMDAIGLDPLDVTHVVFTHGHPDHLWGVLDDFDEPLFANATHMMGRSERDYWLNPNTIDTIGSERQSFAAGALRRLEAIEGALEVFEAGAEILPGIASVATYGHTPGHMAFELRNGSDSVMVLGDCIGNHHVAFAKPDWSLGSDQDAPTAAATRVQLLDRLTAEQMQVVGFHLPGGGLGRAEKAPDGGYRFIPAGA